MNQINLNYRGYEKERETGYEQITPSQVMAALAFLVATTDIEKFRNEWVRIDTSGDHNTPDRYMRGVLDLLDSQWILDKNESGEYRLNATFLENGGNEKLQIAIERVKYFEQVLATVESDLNWPTEKNSVDPLTTDIFENLEPEITISAALAVLKASNMIEKLLNNESVQIDPKLEKYIFVLKKAGIINQDDQTHAITVTEKGKPALKLAGYAMLNLSYYYTYSNLEDLYREKIDYGLGKGINRHQRANAEASNGIIKIKVAPTIADTIANSAFLKEYAKERKLTAVDYGSGGGDMSRIILDRAQNMVGRTIGMDISETAVQTASLLSQVSGHAEDTQFMVGNITQKTDMEKLKKTLEDEKAVHTINFILHEKPEIAHAFLENFAEVFGDQPLIITETIRIPRKALRAHPNTQAPSFNFMHEISGQTLYSIDALKRMLEQYRFTIVDSITHSSMRDEDNRPHAYEYIISLVVQKLT